MKTIDTKTETLITLADATKLLPSVNGKRINISTLWRWCRKGLRGVTLEYTRVGAKIITSSEALHRFFTALAELDAAQSSGDPPIRLRNRRISSESRQRAIDDTNAILRKAKIIV